ncbi:hypothetical protein ACLOJK_018906 [Asimina triloba]
MNSYNRKRNSVSSPNIAEILAVRGHHKGYKALRNPHESGSGEKIVSSLRQPDNLQKFKWMSLP